MVQIVVSTLAYFIMVPLMTHKLGIHEGKAQIGVWATVTAIPAAMSIFGSGVSGCVVRYLPVYATKHDLKQINLLIVNGLLLNLLLASVIVALGYYFSEPLLRFLFSVHRVPAFYISVFHLSLAIFFLTFLNSVFLSSLDGLQLIYRKNLVLIFSSVVFCALCVFFIDRWGLTGLLYAQLAQAVIAGSCAFGVLRVAGILGSGMQFSRVHQKLFFTFGRKMQFISVSILLFDPITKYFLNRYADLPLVGIYELANRAVTQARTMVVSAIQVIVPVVSKQNEEKSLDISALYQKAVRGGTLLSIAGYGMLISLAVTLVALKDAADMPYYLTFIALLAVAYTVNIIASVPYSILMGIGDLNHIVKSHLLSTGLNGLFFLAVSVQPRPLLMVLPPVFSVLLSSLYVLRVFKRSYPTPIFSLHAEDGLLFGLSAASVFAALIAYFCGGSVGIMAGLNVLFVTATGIAAVRNSFLTALLGKLFLKRA